MTDVIRCNGNSGSVTLCGTRATLLRLSINAGALILTTLLLRILCLTNRMRPSWHGSGRFLGEAPVLSRFGTRETKTAAPMNQNSTLAARRRAGGLGLRPGIFPNSEESK